VTLVVKESWTAMSRTNLSPHTDSAIKNRHWKQPFSIDTSEYLAKHCWILGRKAWGYPKTTKDQLLVKDSLKYWKVRMKCFTD